MIGERSLMLSGGYLLVVVKVASRIIVNQNATSLKSSKTQFHFQFELSFAELSPSLFPLTPAGRKGPSILQPLPKKIR